jgi:hypothetical protein
LMNRSGHRLACWSPGCTGGICGDGQTKEPSKLRS